MNFSKPVRTAGLLGILALSGWPGLAVARINAATLTINRTPTHLAVSWSGRGTLQSAQDLTGVWEVVLEASHQS